MAVIRKKNKEKKNTKKEITKEIETNVVKGLKEVANDTTPVLKEELNGDLSIIGDASKIDTPTNDTVYKLKFIFPTNEFKPEELEDFSVTKTNKEFVTATIEATQEPVTPFNRKFLSAVAFDLITTFLVPVKDENGKDTKEWDLPDSDDEFTKIIINFYRNDFLLENTKFFIGKLLGLNAKYIPYMEDLMLSNIALDLIRKNPTLMNEAFFSVK